MKKDLNELKRKYKQLPEEDKNIYLSDKDIDERVHEFNNYSVPAIIARYWRPALNGSEAKVLDYIIYKTFAFEKGRVGDEIALSQMLEGTTKKIGKKVIKRTDWGTGVSKPLLLDALNLLEALDIIEVIRKGQNQAKSTNRYRLKIHEEFDSLPDDAQKQSYLLKDPFVEVKKMRNFLISEGVIKGR